MRMDPSKKWYPLSHGGIARAIPDEFFAVCFKRPHLS